MSALKKSKSLKRNHAKSAIPQIHTANIKQEKEALIQFPFVELDNDLECPLTTASIPSVSGNCTEACKISFLEIKAELKALKKLVSEQTKLLKQLTSAPNVPALEVVDHSLHTFPLNAEVDLAAIEEHINEDNRYFYVQRMREIINSDLGQNLQRILSDEIILSFNLDGIHGKKRIRDYEAFTACLLDAINTPEETDRPEIALRNAIQIQKKRCYRRKCARKAQERERSLKKSYNGDFDDDDDDDDDEYFLN